MPGHLPKQSPLPTATVWGEDHAYFTDREVKEPATVTEPASSRARVPTQTSLPLKLRIRASHQTAWNQAAAAKARVQTNLFSLQAKSQPGTKSPWVKTAAHQRFCFVLLIHLKGNLVSNQH